MGEEVSVSRGFESFSEEIPHMPETDEDHVADIGREQNVVRWVLFLGVNDGLARGMLRGEAVFLVHAMTKFRMNGAEDLLGSWGNAWVGESIVIVEHLGLAFA